MSKWIVKGFKNEVICFTGKSAYRRFEMENMAKEVGGHVSKNISSKTTILVMGQRPGSKLDRAFNKGVHIMMDEEFIQVVKKKIK